MKKSKFVSIIGIALTCSLGAGIAQAQPATGDMSFFLTSAGSGNGGDLGGLEGADAICQSLADGVGRGSQSWKAYLSTQGASAINARDRIGSGPWFNADGTMIAADLATLHSTGNRLSASTMLDERGRRIPGSGFAPNRHDILTGSQADGNAYPAGEDMSCENWTNSSDGTARVGHHDFAAWNSTHNSRGCSQEGLVSTGGDGLFYCFAE